MRWKGYGPNNEDAAAALPSCLDSAATIRANAAQPDKGPNTPTINEDEDVEQNTADKGDAANEGSSSGSEDVEADTAD